MICKNCGQELSNESIFCNKCGSKVETTVEDLKPVVEESIDVVEKVQTVEEKNIVNNAQNLDKKKFLIIGAVALVVIVLITSLFGGGRDYQGSNAPVYTEDDFGANNEVVTQPQTTEAITVSRPNVEVIVNRTKFYSPLNGTAELVDYQVSDSAVGVVLEVKIKVVDKTNKSNMWDSFQVPCAAYDANGTLLFDNAAFGEGWKIAEEGEILKCTFNTYKNKDVVARIEIG